MALSYVGEGTGTDSSVTTVTVNKPTGAAENDLMFVWINRYTNTVNPDTVPTGWTLVSKITSSPAGHDAWLYYKVCGASEPSSWSWVFTTAGSAYTASHSYAIRGGFDTASPIHESLTVTGFTTSDSSYDTTTQSKTTGHDNQYALAFGGSNNGDVTGITAGWTLDDAWSGDTATYCQSISHRLFASASSSTGEITLTISGGSDFFYGLIITLNPEAGGVTVTGVHADEKLVAKAPSMATTLLPPKATEKLHAKLPKLLTTLLPPKGADRYHAKAPQLNITLKPPHADERLHAKPPLTNTTLKPPHADERFHAKAPHANTTLTVEHGGMVFSAHPIEEAGELTVTIPAPAKARFHAKAPRPTAGTLITCDGYSQTNRNTQGVLYAGASNVTARGQSFKAMRGTLDSARVYMSKIGSPPGVIYAKLYLAEGAYGTDNQPTGSVLAISDPVTADTLTTGWRFIDFTFDNSYRLSSGTVYELVIEYDNGDTSNYVQVGIDNTSPTHAGNGVLYQSGAWTPTAWDICFTVSIRGVLEFWAPAKERFHAKAPTLPSLLMEKSTEKFQAHSPSLSVVLVVPQSKHRFHAKAPKTNATLTPPQAKVRYVARPPVVVGQITLNPAQPTMRWSAPVPTPTMPGRWNLRSASTGIWATRSASTGSWSTGPSVAATTPAWARR